MKDKIAGELDNYVRFSFFPTIVSCCNGLLLLNDNDGVVNPATRQWARLPPRPPTPDGMEGVLYYMDQHLVFDPSVSPHYQVFLLPYVGYDFEVEASSLTQETEWPLSPCKVHVFSSRTGVWEQRSYVREGEPVGTIGDVMSAKEPYNRHAVYWRQRLYVHCYGDFIMR